MNEAEPTVIWELGDTWRDLREDVIASGSVTIVTEHCTTHLVDLAAGTTVRYPRSIGSVLPLDGEERTLCEIAVATPCGLVTIASPSSQSQSSTHLVLVLAGRWPQWPQTPPGERVTTAHPTHEWEALAGHPTERCGALYCHAKENCSGLGGDR